MEAFNAFVETEDCPEPVRAALYRQVERDALRQMTRNSAHSSSLSGDESEVEDDFSYEDIESARDSVDEFMAAEEVADNIDQHFAQLSNVNQADYPYSTGMRSADVMEGGEAYLSVDEMNERWNKLVEDRHAHSSSETLPAVNPVLAINNEDQRYVLSLVLHHLRSGMNTNNSPIPHQNLSRCGC